MAKQKLRQGNLSDEEKRIIEQMAPNTSYAQIARTLNRNQATVRKYCQRNGITDDLPSIRKQIEFKTKNNHHFEVLKTQLTKNEYDFAIQVYKGMMEQFGNDILYSEEVQLIEYCMVTCLLNRAISKEKLLNEQIDQQRILRADLQKKKDEVIKQAEDSDDEDDEAEKYDKEDYYLDKIEQIDIRISEIQSELRDTKKDQINFIDRKEKITTAIHGSREQRAKDLINTKQNFSDLITSMRKNQEFRRQIGLELEKMRIGIKEEYIRLTDNPHLYADGQEDFPIYNSEVALRANQKENDGKVIYIPDDEEEYSGDSYDQESEESD